MRKERQILLPLLSLVRASRADGDVILGNLG